jgi:pyruvate kinase
LPETCLRLSLVWGVTPIRIETPRSTDELMDRVPGIAVASGHVRTGDRIVITAGIPVGVSGSTNTIKASVVGG